MAKCKDGATSVRKKVADPRIIWMKKKKSQRNASRTASMNAPRANTKDASKSASNNIS